MHDCRDAAIARFALRDLSSGSKFSILTDSRDISLIRQLAAPFDFRGSQPTDGIARAGRGR
jgi:hypothetical protein